MNLNTFWKQPAEGFTEETRGRTEEEINRREEQIGFKLPDTFKKLMKLQNGGYLRKSAFYYKDECRELLYNGATIDKISPTPIGYQTMFDVLSEWKDEDEMNSLSPTKYNNLKRLPLISHMDGHEWMCFDYGWTEKDQKPEPEICFFNDEFREYLRLPNFDEFVKGLVYYGYESCEYFFGINSNDSIKTLANQFSSSLNIEFEEKSNNRHGWFNFKKWYSGKKVIEDNLEFHVNLSPNKFLNNTFLFQEYPMLNYVIGIIPMKSKFESIANNSNKYRKMMKDMLSEIEKNNEIIDLLVPENIEK